MSEERYDKRGRTARVEWLRGSLVRHTLEERGCSRATDHVFRATAGETLIEHDPPRVDPPDIGPILAACRGPALTRIVASGGATVHRFQHDSILREWERRDELVHVEMLVPQTPFVLSLEWMDQTAEAAKELTSIIGILPETRGTFPVRRITMAPRVTATLLAARIASGVLEAAVQVATSERDGDGVEIRAADLTSTSEPPNRVRPSYRYPARRAWTHCALISSDAPFELAPVSGVALLAQRYDRTGARLVVMVFDGTKWGALELAGEWSAWSSAIGASSSEMSLYPFAPAPHFGSLCTLDTTRLSARFI